VSQFEYVAVLISIIVGLALTQILRGVGRMVTTKQGPRPYWVHLIWTFYLFLNIILFWWWEFRLGTIEWSLSVYLVVITYSTLFFFVSLVMQPGSLDGVASYKEYFYSHRRWIFGLIIAITLLDFVDTLIKGMAHFSNLGAGYLAIQFALISASGAAIITSNERYHEVFATTYLIAFFVFQYRNFFVIS
jgi:hypothetical protein